MNKNEIYLGWLKWFGQEAQFSYYLLEKNRESNIIYSPEWTHLEWNLYDTNKKYTTNDVTANKKYTTNDVTDATLILDQRIKRILYEQE